MVEQEIAYEKAWPCIIFSSIRRPSGEYGHELRSTRDQLPSRRLTDARRQSIALDSPEPAERAVLASWVEHRTDKREMGESIFCDTSLKIWSRS